MAGRLIEAHIHKSWDWEEAVANHEVLTSGLTYGNLDQPLATGTGS